MSGAHAHSHGGSAGHHRGLSWTLGLVLVYMFVEIVGGWLSNSLAVLADAGHMFSDAGSLVIALLAMRIARRPATPTHTFGYWRVEVLAALANAAILVAVTGFIGYHAIGRLSSPAQVQGPLMLAVAIGGLLVNFAGLYFLHDGKSESLNVRGAWLHVLADTFGSVGAIVSGVLITLFGWHLADPLASLFIALLVLLSAWSLLVQTTGVLMQAVPRGIELARVEQVLMSVEGVIAIHDLHVWSVTSERAIMSAHLRVSQTVDRQSLMAEIQSLIRDEFEVHHSTFQLECTMDCESESCNTSTVRDGCS